jgi:hypothetical protein
MTGEAPGARSSRSEVTTRSCDRMLGARARPDLPGPDPAFPSWVSTSPGGSTARSGPVRTRSFLRARAVRALLDRRDRHLRDDPVPWFRRLARRHWRTGLRSSAGTGGDRPSSPRVAGSSRPRAGRRGVGT